MMRPSHCCWLCSIRRRCCGVQPALQRGVPLRPPQRRPPADRCLRHTRRPWPCNCLHYQFFQAASLRSPAGPATQIPPVPWPAACALPVSGMPGATQGQTARVFSRHLGTAGCSLCHETSGRECHLALTQYTVAVPLPTGLGRLTSST